VNAGRKLLREFDIRYPTSFGSSRNKKARGKEKREQFVAYVRGRAGAKDVVECPVAVTFRVSLNVNQRVSDLDGLVEPFLNALEGHFYKDDVQVAELHAYRDYVLGESKIEIRLETLPDNTPNKLLKRLVTQADKLLRHDPMKLETISSGAELLELLGVSVINKPRT
jgi:Holliday junction resolvase RusA-like endonuclease